VTSVPYTRWLNGSLVLYIGVVILLVVVQLAGTVKLGATRWITVFGLSVQPSELAKLACACIVARSVALQPHPLSMRTLVVSASLVALPAFLVFVQPDLGTSSIIGVIWLGMVWVAGISRKHLTILATIMLCSLPIGWHFLKDYQRTRLLVFLNPHVDPLGAGYTIIQSQIAIGSGGLFGRGWMAGTQNQLNFLPERHADFLFSVVGEEWGFLGSVTVVVAFSLFLWRAVSIAMRNSDLQGRMLAMGLTSWIAYQALVNMGMVMGLVPVVGVPLPLVSYGGSAMVAAWIVVGLLQSIYRFGTRF